MDVLFDRQCIFLVIKICSCTYLDIAFLVLIGGGKFGFRIGLQINVCFYYCYHYNIVVLRLQYH